MSGICVRTEVKVSGTSDGMCSRFILGVCIQAVVSATTGQVTMVSQVLVASLAHRDVVLSFCVGLLLLAAGLKLLEELIHMIRSIAMVLAVVLALSLLVGH